MKNINTKALMVVVLIAASAFATPMMVSGYDYEDDYIYNQFGIGDPLDVITGFSGGLGNIFRGLGYGGNYLGLLFEMLLMQTLTNFSSKEVMPGVFVLSASIEKTINDTRDFTTPKQEVYMVPYDYIEGAYNVDQYGYAYCTVTTEGKYDFELTVGAAVTLIIWDNDKSFLNAVMKLVNFFQRARPILEGGSPTEEQRAALIKEGVELITWFLIHINDIFTGEELFILNPITWQKLKITPQPGYSITKEWKVTGNDWNVDPSSDNNFSTVPDSETILGEWNISAKANKDSYMEWLLTDTDPIPSLETVFTSFTFDLIQLWIKNFYVAINVAEIMNLMQGGGGGPVNIANIFQGLDIEFYLFTHHLTGAFLYNDTNGDGRLSADYVQLNQTGSNDPVQVPRSSELTHRLILGTVADFDFAHPTKNTGKNSLSWGLTLNDPTITPVPVGVDLDSYLSGKVEYLEYIKFGFTFEPKSIELPTTDGGTVPVLHGAVKLDQEFGPWNDPESYYANSDIAGLDLAIVYVSTVLHFHLTVNTLGEDPNDPLNPEDDYSNVTHSLKIGNYLPRNIATKLDFVDIAGPEYLYGSESTRFPENATTNILPLVLFEVDANAHKTFEGNTEVTPFAADIGLNITFSAMMYAVCFPTFGNGLDSGPGIWHDPTFSVFMVFDAKGFWAIILLVAGVGLVGVATILIKRRKDARI